MNQLLLLVAIVLLAGCAGPKNGTPEAIARSPQGKHLESATKCCAELMFQGKLPGVAKDELGSLETEAIPCDSPFSFPASVRIHITKKDGSEYSYTFRQDAAASAWRLASASRVNKDGRVLEELFPK
jgi:hypothetical protein